MTFGIPTSQFPVLTDGSVDISHHRRWIQARRDLEARRRRQELQTAPVGSGSVYESHENYPSMPSAASSPSREHDEIYGNGSDSASYNSTEIYLPTSRDILFGRGKPYQQHLGNVRLSLTLESLKERYEALPRQDKTALAQDIVKAFKAKGSRFLRQPSLSVKADVADVPLWKEVKDSEAREKVSQLFRSMRHGKQHQGAASGSGGVERSLALDVPDGQPIAKKRGRMATS